jgi:hypothetical protein
MHGSKTETRDSRQRWVAVAVLLAVLAGCMGSVTGQLTERTRERREHLNSIVDQRQAECESTSHKKRCSRRLILWYACGAA